MHYISGPINFGIFDICLHGQTISDYHPLFLPNLTGVFLQGIMCAGILKGKEMWDLIDHALQCVEYRLPDNQMAKHRYLKDFLKCINEEIEQINMKIEHFSDEESKKKTKSLILVNRNSNGLSAMVDYTKVELEYLKIVLRHIMESDDKQISMIYALNRVNDLQGKRFSQGDAEDFLKRLCKDHWIRYTEGNDGIKLAPRFVKEMEPYLKVVYEDYTGTCVACQKFVMKVSFLQKELCVFCNSTNYFGLIAEP